jgi:NADPH2:quinone reductase
MTAQYLVKKTHAVQPGDVVLVHAAAGGVGLILVALGQGPGAPTWWARPARPPSCALAQAEGADACIDYTQPDWVAQVVAATGGRKARVVYDSVAQHTFMGSLDCCAPFGMGGAVRRRFGPGAGHRARAC